ncbi:type II toxin-antitoxin system HigB family toxin [Pseudomonas sp. NFACC04-2]|uniref:type II toxin-antitoxin system HigB family toxin n=1 Tax=Pseudomonas sp. NFACC04-2 TaxID=1566242 RepID=UPI0009086240|nr:type II toxin-antitoxin system HigB family toxin [Pseudomonas sp. NFACC04-2]SFW61996.1 HigB_toxin, RelE-like toxic component of a toxin-antitoxin system [Pseudomonas sp. NFACC04-2]
MKFLKETERLGLAALLLQKILDHPGDLFAVRGLQSFLLRQVINVEHRVKRLKSARNRLVSSKRGSRRVVFNIKGNDCRLVVAIAYRFGAVYIKFVGTHRRYDGIDANTVEME